jgi:hypothetical protein
VVLDMVLVHRAGVRCLPRHGQSGFRQAAGSTGRGKRLRPKLRARTQCRQGKGQGVSFVARRRGEQQQGRRRSITESSPPIGASYLVGSGAAGGRTSDRRRRRRRRRPSCPENPLLRRPLGGRRLTLVVRWG